MIEPEKIPASPEPLDFKYTNVQALPGGKIVAALEITAPLEFSGRIHRENFMLLEASPQAGKDQNNG